MAETVADLNIIIRAKNAAKAVLGKIDNQVKGLRDNVKKYEKQIALAAKATAVVVGLGVTLFAGAVSQAADFEQSMANVGAVSKASVEDLNQLSRAALDMGSKSVFSATQAADAQLFLAQAGQNTTQIIQSLSGVMSLAAATGSDLAFAAETTASTLSQFSLEAGEAGRVANLFAASTSESQANLSKLASGLRQVGPVANAVGVSLEETVAALNLLFNAGFKGEQAGTILRGALSSLLKPSKDASELIQQLGISIFDTSGNIKPFVELIREFEKANLDATQAITIFGTEAGPGLLALLKQGSDALADMQEKITGTTEAERQAEARTKTLKGAITSLKSAVEGLSISIGQGFLPVITDGAKALKNFVEQINLNRAFEAKKNAETIEGAYLRIKNELIEIDKFVSKFDTTGKAARLDQLLFGDDPLKVTKQRRDSLLIVKKALEDFSSTQVAAARQTKEFRKEFSKIVDSKKVIDDVGVVKREIESVTKFINGLQKELDTAIQSGKKVSAEIKFNSLEQAKSRLEDLKNILKDLQSPNLDIQGLPIVAAGAWREYSEALNGVNQAQLRVLEGERALLGDELSAAEKKLASIQKVIDVQEELEQFQSEIRNRGLSEEQRNQEILSQANEKFRKSFQVQGQERINLLRQSANEAKKAADGFEAGSARETLAIGAVQQSLKLLAQEIKIQENLDPLKSLKDQKESTIQTINEIQAKFKTLKSEIANLEAVIKISNQEKLIADADKIRNELLVKFSSPIVQEVLVKQSSGTPGKTSSSNIAVASSGFKSRSSGGVAQPSGKFKGFATGIRFVPRDQFAQIHRGERVLTAQENRQLGSDSLSGRTISFGDVVVQVANSTEAPEMTARRIHEELKRLDERKDV